MMKMIFGGRATPPKWSVGLCGCGQHPKTCCVTCCLPCITFGQIAEVADEGRSWQGIVYGLLMMVQCQWAYSCMYREKVRAKYGLPAEPCCDCCVHFWCGSCALCQEHAELKARGNDPSQGWTTTRPPNTFSIFR